MKLLSDLFVNLCVLGMVIFVFNLLSVKRAGFISPAANGYRKLHFGANMGVLGIISMFYTIHFSHTILDLRQIPVVFAAIYGGFFASIVAALFIAIGRLVLFTVNQSSLFAVGTIVIVGISCGAMSWLKLGAVKKLLLMTVSNLILTSFVFFLLIKDPKQLLNIYAGYWSVTLVGGWIIFYLMEYLRQTKELYQTAQKSADTDFLTGLNNLRRFDELLKASAEQAHEHGGQVSLILLDIDYFKRINDTHGHQAGDAILKQLSEVLRKSCPPKSIVSRNGGEEFTVILPSGSHDQTMEAAETIRSAVERNKFVLAKGASVKVTVSLGVSMTQGSTESLEHLIKQADECLYHAKSTGRNKVVDQVPERALLFNI